MITLPVAIGGLLGFVTIELLAIASRRNNNPPSLAYYWSLQKNRLNLAINGLLTLAALIGLPEVAGIASDPRLMAEWPILGKFAWMIEVAPFWTALGLGLFSAFFIRKLITIADQRFGQSKKARQTTPAQDADGV